MDEESRLRILDSIQDNFPIVHRPFQKISEQLRIKEDDLVRHIRDMKAEKKIRRLGAVFDSGKLGFTSVLCAAKAPAFSLERIAGIVNGYAGVTHNYIRDHPINLWFTCTASSSAELARITDEISEKAGIKIYRFPAKRVFKIATRFRY